jgi:excisionase family DNA binding protein
MLYACYRIIFPKYISICKEGGFYTLDEKFFTPEEVAVILKRTPNSVKRLLRIGVIKGFKLTGRSWRVKESDLQDFIEKRMVR